MDHYNNKPMENHNIQTAKTALASFLKELREKRANPFRGTALKALSAEIRELRKTHGLSYKEIADKLATLQVKTDEAEVGEFCRRLLKTGRPRKTASSGRTSPA